MPDNPTIGVHVAAANIVDLTAADIIDAAGIASNSDTDVPSVLAMKTYADGKLTKTATGTQTVTGGYAIANSGGFVGPITGDIKETVPAATTTSGAITAKQGLVRLGSGGALAMSLADPVNSTDDGKRLTLMASTAHAHVVTVTGGIAGGSDNTITLGGAVGDMAELEAIGGKWFLRPSINAAASHV